MLVNEHGASWASALIVAIFALQAVLSAAQSCSSLEEVYVSPAGSNAGCCGPAGRPCGTLARAVKRVASGGKLVLYAGTHSTSGASVDLSGSLTVSAVQSNNPDATILNCAKGGCLQASCAGASCAKSVLSLVGFTIQNGANVTGGCLSVEGQGVSLTNMTFKGCAASKSGGAISLVNANADLQLTTISASSSAGLQAGGGGIHLSGSNLTAATLTIDGCSATNSDGGGIQAMNSILSLSANSLISDCTAGASGGGLATKNSEVTMELTKLKSSKAALGGGWFDENGLLSLTLVSFLDCSSMSAGNPNVLQAGAAFYGRTVRQLSMANSIVSGGSSGVDGAGVYLERSLSANITGSLFENNIASGDGAGLYMSDSAVEVRNCVFKGNRWVLPYNGGGGIYATNSHLRVVDNTRFINNGLTEMDMPQAQTGAGIAFYLVAPMTSVAPGSLYIDGATFTNNKAQTGGGLYTVEITAMSPVLTGLSVVVKNTHFDGNYAAFSGGGVAQISGMEMSGCTFTGNSAGETGGAISQKVEHESVNITDCVFINNTAGTNGGAFEVAVGGDTITNMRRNYFEGNTAPTGYGGAVFYGGSAATVDSCEFVANTAGIAGGALEMEASASTGGASQGTLYNCTFTGNSAPLGGGAFHASSAAKAVLKQCKFLENNSTQGGAILMSDYTNFQFPGLVCNNNMASEGGGCLVLLDSAKASVTDGTLRGNEGTSSGGAAKLTGKSTLDLRRCNVTENTAPVGGAIWAEIGSSMTAVRTTFLRNTAKFQGGAVYQTHRASTTWQHCTFQENGGLVGGAVYADTYSQLTSLLTSWLANQGSALHIKGSATASVTRNYFLDNKAASSGNGGAVWASDASSLESQLSRFTNNSGVMGGAIYSDGQAGLTLNRSRFDGNTAQQGGAVAVDGEGEVIIARTQFENNGALTSGGALALVGASSGRVGLSNFTDNQAGGDGAGVYVKRTAKASDASPPLTCSDLTFSGSVAANSQGAAFFDASFDPKERVNCVGCKQLTSSDSFGTVPTFYRYVWPGQNDTGVNATFRVLASSGDPIVFLQIMVLDSYGRFITTDQNSVASVTPTPRISGLLTGTARNGLITIPTITVSVNSNDLDDLELEVTLSSPTDAYPPITRFLKVGFCQPGHFYSSRSFQCQACPLGQWCAGGQPTQFCPDGSFSFQLGASSPANCSGCEGGLKCSNGNSTILEGFWMDVDSLPLRPAVYGCDSSRGCAGFQYMGEIVDQCKAGYQDRVCSSCSDGFYGFLSSCSRCSDGYKAAFTVVVLVTVVLWIAINWLTSIFTGADIMVVEMQFLAMVGAYNLNYFGGTWISSIFQVFNITLFYPDFLGPECVNNGYGFAQRWVFTAVLPWAGVGVYLFFYLLDDLRSTVANASHSLEWLRPRLSPLERKWALIKSICNLLDLMYVSVAIRCFQAFHWQTYDKKVLSADPTIVWLSGTHVAILPFAVIYTAFYIIGLPLFYSMVLFRGKALGRLHERSYLEKYGLLYERYEPELFWWYLPMTWGRRLAYAAILVFWSGHPDMQAYLTFLLVLVLGLIHYFIRPHKAAALDILVGILFLGQYLYLLAGTANSYMSTYVAGDPAEAVAGTALLLFLLVAAIIMVFELHELWARFWARQWALANGDRDAQAKQPRVPLITFSSFCGSSKLKKKAEEKDTGDVGEGELVPLEEVVSWFNPHAMTAFLRFATLSDLNLLQMIRVTYSYHVPGKEETWQAGRILDALPKPLRYAFINELLIDIDMDDSTTITSNAASTFVSHASSPLNRAAHSLSTSFTGMSLEKVHSAALSADAGASLEKLHGLQRIKELRMLAESAAGDKRKAGDTLRLLINPRYVEPITAWLLYDEYDGRRAMKELLTKFNQWLHILPEERSWLGKADVPLWELQMRRRLRRFKLKLSL